MPSSEHATPVRHKALVAVQLCLELWDIASVKLPALSKNYPPSPSHQRASHVAVIGALIAAICGSERRVLLLRWFRMGSVKIPTLPHPTSALPMLRSSAVPYGSYWDRYC